MFSFLRSQTIIPSQFPCTTVAEAACSIVGQLVSAASLGRQTALQLAASRGHVRFA